MTSLANHTHAPIEPQDMADITAKVAGFYHVKIGDMKSSCRRAHLVRPRHVAWYLIRRHTSYSLEEIGGFFGSRDHTTVLHGVQKIGREIAMLSELAAQVVHLSKMCEQKTEAA